MTTIFPSTSVPVLALFSGKGFTKDMYDALLKSVGWKVSHPDGGIIHIASFDSEGDIHVADLWESAEKLNAFVSQKLAPAMQKLSIPMPHAEVYPVDNVDAYQAVMRYVNREAK